jgi:hypothetical protein
MIHGSSVTTKYADMIDTMMVYPLTALFAPKLAILPMVNPAIKQKTPIVPATSFSLSSIRGLRAGVEETMILSEPIYLFYQLMT